MVLSILLWAGLLCAYVRSWESESTLMRPLMGWKPHNTTLVFLGTTLIWFGWFGLKVSRWLYNSKLVLSVVLLFSLNRVVRPSTRASERCWHHSSFNTNTTACTGVLGWVLVELDQEPWESLLVDACEGAIAGLVGITPAAGIVSVWLAAGIGFFTSIVCALLQDINNWMHNW